MRLQTIRLQASQLTVYMGGSTTAGTRVDGAGVIVICSDPADPTTLHRSHVRGVVFSSLFGEEAAAMQLVLE